MKYFVALCLLAAPLALSAAPTPAEAHVRNGVTCHWIKKTSWRHGRKHVRFVKKCRRRPAFHKRQARRDVRNARRYH